MYSHAEQDLCKTNADLAEYVAAVCRSEAPMKRTWK